jgi:hypothetical protein
MLRSSLAQGWRAPPPVFALTPSAHRSQGTPGADRAEPRSRGRLMRRCGWRWAPDLPRLQYGIVDDDQLADARDEATLGFLPRARSPG